MAIGSTTSLTFDLLAKDKTASRTFERFGRTVDDTDSKLSKIGGTMATVGKTAAKGLAVGVAAAGVALAAFGKSAVDEAREAQKVSKQTEAVIKSTGGAAKVTAGHVADLAGKLSMKAGIDDEAIQSGQNLLLTFTNIRNEVGKGNAIFDRASSVALDMSVALGKDMRSASIQVGKALNDPIKGLSALTRVGVTFSEQQEANIEKLVEEGHTLRAQKIILAELDKKFAGSAAAQATAGEKAKVAWENFQEEIGKKLLPLLDKLAVFFVNEVIPALRQFSAWFQREAIPVIKKFATQAQELLNRFVGWVREHWPEIRAVIVDVLDTIVENWKQTVAIITRIWQKWGDDLFRILGPILENIGTQIRAALKILRGIFKVFSGLLQGDWGKMWDGFKDIFGGAWDSLKGNIKTQLKVLKAIFATAWDAIKDVFKDIWNEIKAVLTKAWEGIKTYYGTQFKILKAFYSRVWDGIKAVFSKAWDAIKTVLTKAWEGIKTYYGTQFKLLKAAFDRLWDGVKKVTGTAWSAIKTVISNVWENGIRPVFETIKTAVGKIPDAFNRAKEGIGRVWSKVKELAAAPIRFVVNTVYNQGIRPVVNAIPFIDDIPEITFRKGGYTGFGNRDQVAGLVHADEFVIRSEARRKIEKYNPGFLDRLNKTGLPGHRKGGHVNPLARVTVDGEPLTAVHAAQLAIAGQLMGTHQYVVQGSWQAPSSYSGTSHTGPGVADTVPGSFRAQYVQRRAGIAAWARNIPGAAYAGSGAHVHGVSMFSAPGNSQLAAYRAGGDGLGGRDYGARPPLLPGLRGLLSAFNIASIVSGGLGGFNAAEAKDNFFEAMKNLWGHIKKLRGMPGWGRLYANAMSGIASRLKDWGLEKIKAAADKAREQFFPGLGFERPFDTGGILQPGWNQVYNGTGRPEHLRPVPKPRVSQGNRSSGGGPVRVVLEIDGREILGVIRGVAREEITDEFKYMGSAVG